MSAALTCAAGPAALGATSHCNFSSGPSGLHSTQFAQGCQAAPYAHASSSRQPVHSGAALRRPKALQRRPNSLGTAFLPNSNFLSTGLIVLPFLDNAASQKQHCSGTRAAADGAGGARRSRTSSRGGSSGKASSRQTVAGTRKSSRGAEPGAVPANGALLLSAAILAGGIIYLAQSGKLGIPFPRIEFKKPGFLEGMELPEASPEQKAKQARGESKKR